MNRKRKEKIVKDKLGKLLGYIREGKLKEMWKQTGWILQYARRYWKAMVIYTLLGLTGTAVSLISSLISKDLVDIITGHQTESFLALCGLMDFSIGNILSAQLPLAS